MRKWIWVCVCLVILTRVYFSCWQVARPVLNSTKLCPATGVIASIPICQNHRCHFLFTLNAVKRKKQRLYLSWYGAHPQLQVGTSWRFACKLRSSRKKTPLYFQHWLQLHHILAVGNIQAHGTNVRLSRPLAYPIARVRQRIQDIIAASVSAPDLAAVIAALGVGSRALLTTSIWQVFQRTGTSHLVAISGLHVGLVAVSAERLLFWCVRSSVWLLRLWPAAQWARLGAILVAIGYALLAGLSLPTQRALIMLLAYYMPLLGYINILVWRRLLLAFMVIIFLEPAAVFAAGFWLSFAAVATIAYVIRARLARFSSWQQWVRLHLATVVGLSPLTLYFFGQISLIAVLANIIAIPWITMLIIPVVLIGCMLALVHCGIAPVLFKLAAILLAPLWHGLQLLSLPANAVWLQPNLSGIRLMLGLLAVMLLLSPLQTHMRILGLCLLLVLFV